MRSSINSLPLSQWRMKCCTCDSRNPSSQLAHTIQNILSTAGHNRWWQARKGEGITKLQDTCREWPILKRSYCDRPNKDNLCFFRCESGHPTVGPTEPVSAGHHHSDLQGKTQLPEQQHGQGFSNVQGQNCLFLNAVQSYGLIFRLPLYTGSPP